jgi:hypothetical protein
MQSYNVYIYVPSTSLTFAINEYLRGEFSHTIKLNIVTIILNVHLSIDVKSVIKHKFYSFIMNISNIINLKNETYYHTRTHNKRVSFIKFIIPIIKPVKDILIMSSMSFHVPQCQIKVWL